MVQKRKLVITLIISLWVIIAVLLFVWSEYNKSQCKANTLMFDFGLTERLGDEYVKGTPEPLSPEDYNKAKITETFWGFESITDFLPDEGNFVNATIFTFNEIRHSIDAIQTYVYELCLECEYETSQDCDEVWMLLQESTVGQRGLKPQLVDDLFVFPSLVFVYNSSTTFEYCLKTGNRSIAYISFSAIESKTNLVFDSDYQPSRTLFESSFPKNLIVSDGSFRC